MPKRPVRLALLILLCLTGLASAQGVAPARPAGVPPAERGVSRAPGAAAAPPALSLRAVWAVELPASPSGPPAYDAERLFLPIGRRVIALGLERGDVAWTVEAPAAALAAGGGLVFLAAGDAVEARVSATGARAWTHAAGELLAPALSWNGGWLLAGTPGGDALMLGARDGTLLWRQSLGAPIGPRAAMTADRVYILLEDGRVTARRLADGSTIWERRLGGRPTGVRALDDRLFVGAEDRYLYCLDSKDGGERWRWRTGGGVTGTPEVDADRVYFVAFDNVLRALDRGNGHQRWMRPLGFRPTGGPVLVNDLLLVPAISPELAIFRAATGARAGTVPAGVEPAAPPHVLRSPTAAAGEATLIVVGRTGSVARLGPAPPALPAKPIPGVPMYLPMEM